MDTPVTLVIFEGGLINSSLEEEFRQVRMAVVLDLLTRAEQAGFSQVILATPYPDLQRLTSSIKAKVLLEETTAQTADFHFGKKLAEIITARQLSKVLYMGGASAPLITSEELHLLLRTVADRERVVTANNYYSSDIVGFSPAQTLGQIDLPALDNSLAYLLANEGGLPFIAQPKSLGLSFDLDTPADIPILAVHPRTGPYTQETLQRFSIDATRHAQIQAQIQDERRELVVFGRVNSGIFQYLDEHTRCRIRLFSEERGMKSLGRDSRGEVVSVLGRLVEEMGFHPFFSFLSSIASGAVIDSRVLFSHFKWELTQADRFFSDRGMPEKISHHQLREFTEAAQNCQIPILLGGHSLVTGGLVALVDGSYDKKRVLA